MFGTELGSSGRATNALHCAVSIGTTPHPKTNREKEIKAQSLTIEPGTEDPGRKTHQIN